MTESAGAAPRAAPLPWTPQQRRLLRSPYDATVVSNIGTRMQDIESGWLMTSLSSSPSQMGHFSGDAERPEMAGGRRCLASVERPVSVLGGRPVGIGQRQLLAGLEPVVIGGDRENAAISGTHHYRYTC
jgi:Transmembrane secretion effector